MSAFDWAFDTVYEEEKGLVDDARDPGGITNHGISLRFAVDCGDLDRDGRPDLDVDGSGQVDAADIRALTRDQAQAIFKAHFWDLLKCDEIASAGLALQIFDMSVNQGRGPAVSALQQALGVKVDGKLGPVTLKAATEQGGWDTFAVNIEFSARRAVRYAVTKNFDAFGLGWMRRNARIFEQAIAVERA